VAVSWPKLNWVLQVISERCARRKKQLCRKGQRGKHGFTGVEDSPQGFNPEEDMCLAGNDHIASGPVMGGGAIVRELGPGDADDAEREQMPDGVPILPVVTLDYSLFTHRRQPLGISNLTTSFVASGDGVVSADTGKRHRNKGGWQLGERPGVPV
jgi:hypothetical protein